ncbi:hypothetical protein ACVWZK_004158 [Bradyrhizobium sp. GM0.4]
MENGLGKPDGCVSYKTQAIVIGPKAVAGAPRPPRGSFLSKSVWRVRGPRNPDLAKAISLGGGSTCVTSLGGL